MHDSDNQNTPSVGVGEKGDTDPFDEKASVNESLDDLDDELDDDVEGDELDADFDVEEDDIDDGSLDGMDDADVEADEDPLASVEDDAEMDVDVDGAEDGDIAARMDSLEAKLDSILSAINNMKYDDSEPLYSDDDVDADDEDDSDDFEGEDDFEDEDTEVVESISYKNLMARKRINEENRLDDFGKHPAYQKKVMTLPANNNFKKDGQYDMNDSSVDGEAPYGQSKGTQAPFEDGVEDVENAITEAVLRMLKKKLG